MSDAKHSCPNCGYRDTNVTEFTSLEPPKAGEGAAKAGGAAPNPGETVTAVVNGQAMQIPISVLPSSNETVVMAPVAEIVATHEENA